MCHSTDGWQQGFGPDLAFLVKKKDLRHIARSLLQPSEEIKEGYTTQWILTSSGKVVTGLLKAETGNSVELVQQDLMLVAVDKNQIEEQQSQRVSAVLLFGGLIAPRQVADIAAKLLQGPGGK